jgi:hypothetical protein
MSQTKCNKRSWCTAMDTFSGDRYEKSRRIFITESFNMATGKARPAVAYQHGRGARDFVWLNFCPWCGSDISKLPNSNRKDLPSD